MTGILPILIYGFTFLSVLLLVFVGYSVFRKGVKRYEEKYLSQTAQTLDEMFLVFSPEQILYLNLLSVLLLGVIAFLATRNWRYMIMGAIAGLLLPRLILRHLKRKRLKKFDDQLTDALSTLSNSLKAGFSLIQALDMLSREMNPPISQEFGLMLRENKLGVHLDKALQNMTERIQSANLDLVVTSVIIARTAGGNLAEIFDRIANTIREITRLEGKIDALTAQGRLQALVLGLMPVALAVIMYYLDKESMRLLFEDPLGWGILGIIMIFEGIGMFFIWRIVSIDI